VAAGQAAAAVTFLSARSDSPGWLAGMKPAMTTRRKLGALARFAAAAPTLPLMSEAVLVVDDDPDVLKAAGLVIAGQGFAVETAAEPEALEARVRARPYAAALLDMNFAAGARSGEEGLAGLERLQAADPALGVVLMTTYGGVSLAVQGLKRGAADFVMKPWRNADLAAAIASAAELTRTRRAQGALSLDELEKRAIQRALIAYDGNISHAAQALGLTRPALYRRMERHGLEP
jgi:DNA-binding NtrC family response regulator